MQYNIVPDKKNPDGTIIADIVARDLPTEKQASNDSGHGGRSDMIAEVKTMQPGKNAYKKGNSQDNKPVDQRGKVVRKNYKERAAKLDRKLATEDVGTRTNGQVGPFEAALGEFYTGNAYPIIIGAFGEVNEDANKLIKKLARLTAKTDFGKSMSPLVSHSRKGGAFPIMQSQFRRALGCMIARGGRHSTFSKGDTMLDHQHGKLTKQQRTIIVNTDLNRKPACLAMLGGGRTLSPRDMVCTNSGETAKTLAPYRRQSTSVARLVQ